MFLLSFSSFTPVSLTKVSSPDPSAATFVMTTSSHFPYRSSTTHTCCGMSPHAAPWSTPFTYKCS